jgi:hypothetical protein
MAQYGAFSCPGLVLIFFLCIHIFNLLPHIEMQVLLRLLYYLRNVRLGRWYYNLWSFASKSGSIFGHVSVPNTILYFSQTEIVQNEPSRFRFERTVTLSLRGCITHGMLRNSIRFCTPNTVYSAGRSCFSHMKVRDLYNSKEENMSLIFPISKILTRQSQLTYR